MISVILFLLATILSSAAVAADLRLGRVVSVADGDTITLAQTDGKYERVRLFGIDAPETGQAYAAQAKENLSRLVLGRQVSVHAVKRDRYGRVVGKVMVGRTDAGLAQIGAGMAWHFKRYEEEQPPQDRLVYSQAEHRARAARRGLWAEPAPVPPWRWRMAHAK